MKKISSAALAVFVFIFVFMAATQAQSPHETLNQYISDLQKNPQDNVLREKIIRHVQQMSPAPTVPEEAKRYVNRGVVAAESAKNENDYKDAIDEFQKAVNIAPWIGAGYRGLAVMQDQAGQYSQALQSLKFFLLTNPSAADTEAAKTLRDKIEYRQEKAAKESSPAAIAAKKQKEYEEWLKKIDGRRYRLTSEGPAVIEVRGKFLVVTLDGRVIGGPWEIRGRIASTPRVMQQLPFPVQTTYTIIEDGYRIIEHRDFSDGDMREFVWLWQR